jgi:hypothetical protein
VAARAHAVEHLGKERVLQRFESELFAAVARYPTAKRNREGWLARGTVGRTYFSS